jgi:predicted HAD superfamily hydrolase
VLDKRLEESTEVLNGISTFKEYVKEELISQSQKIIESKNNVFDNFDSINKEITSIQISIDEVKSHHEGAIKRIDLN